MTERQQQSGWDDYGRARAARLLTSKTALSGTHKAILQNQSYDAHILGMDKLNEQIGNHLDHLAASIDRRFDKIDQRFEKIDQRFEKIDQRFEKIDQRFDKIDQQFDKQNQRLTSMDDRLRGVEVGFAGIGPRLDGIKAAVDSRPTEGFIYRALASLWGAVVATAIGAYWLLNNIQMVKGWFGIP